MNERTSACPIPNDALEVVTETTEAGTKQKALYLVDGKEIGFRFWYSSGVLGIESGLQNGVMHGLFRTWHDNGKISQESTYFEGKEHGETRQYDEDGAQIGSYVMEFGTGVDLWFCSAGVLAEEREYRDGRRYGFERWWCCDNQTIWEESHFWNDTNHGIFRQWNSQGKLRRGYPQYYIMGKRVKKRQYERACRHDPTLPLMNTDDNQPFRNLPKGVLPE